MPEMELSQSQFDDLERQWPEETVRFERLFFERRHQLMQEQSTEWLALNPLFPGVRTTWSSLQRYPIYIVTTKDQQATTCILGHHELAVAGVYAKGSFEAKADAILAIAEREHVDPSRVAFVDDHPDHLRSVAGTGAWPLFARWGYSPETTADEFARVECFSDLPKVLGG
jgi:phosphoglycolate phosphatase-like HAD superfamily hydrolase